MSTSPPPIGYLIHCKSCGKPLVLRVGMLKGPFELLAPDAISSQSLGVACLNCKHIRNYSLEKDHPDYSPSATSVVLDPRVRTDCVGAFGCVEKTCRIQTLLASPGTATMTDTDREREIDTWIWDDFHCNAGHRIERPEESP